MFRNVLAAALRNLARNRLYAAISIAGLAVGMAAALLTALFIREELTFDHFIPGHERTFEVMVRHRAYGRPEMAMNAGPSRMHLWLTQEFRGLKVTRYALQGGGFGGGLQLRRGDVEAAELVATVDPNFFEMFPFKVVAGQLSGAMARPDGAVLTRSLARKYFGRDDAVGGSLEIDRAHPVRVLAVIEDLPRNSNFTAQAFISSTAQFTALHRIDVQPYTPGWIDSTARTYIQVRDLRQVDELARALPDFVTRHILPARIMATLPGAYYRLELVPIAKVHLWPDVFAEVPPASAALIYALAALAALILMVAAINFVNLMTARAARRAVEVGVRKAAGAHQRHLVVQFVGEAMLYASLAMLIAVALVEIVLPAVNGFLLRDIQLWRDPLGFGMAVALALLVGLLAGIYPALVLAAFRPAVVLKGGLPSASGSTAIRQGLVVLQFAVLIGLVFSVLVIWRQTRFALNEGTHLNKEQVLRVTVASCQGAFPEQVRRLPGVLLVACAGPEAVGNGENNTSVRLVDGRTLLLSTAAVDADYFPLFGITPLAGRVFSHGAEADALTYAPPPPTGPPVPRTPPSVVVNQAALRAMGLPDPRRAVGMTLRFVTGPRPADSAPSRIIGVVPDFAFDLTKGPIRPTAYGIDPNRFFVVNAKLRAGAIPETLASIDRLWKQIGEPRAIRRRFTDEFLNTVYASVIRQGGLIGALAGIAILIACLGLVGLAAFTAERRTKEIGVRKAMGASSPDMVRMLLWQFSRPVLWANLIAWPLGWWAMNRWLHGFTYRIELSPWLFLAASAAALAIALATVSTHAVLVARAKPVGALRYE